MTNRQPATLRKRVARLWLRAEPHVMGRAAVTVVVACLQPAAWGQLLTPVTASAAIQAAGPDALAYVWGGCIVLAGGLLVASYVTGDAEVERALEIAALALVAIVCGVYVAAIVETAGTVGALFLLGTLAALVVNSVGRGVLLVRQIAAARRLAARERDG